jgi:hypothetical protein
MILYSFISRRQVLDACFTDHLVSPHSQEPLLEEYSVAAHVSQVQHKLLYMRS